MNGERKGSRMTERTRTEHQHDVLAHAYAVVEVWKRERQQLLALKIDLTTAITSKNLTRLRKHSTKWNSRLSDYRAYTMHWHPLWRRCSFPCE